MKFSLKNSMIAAGVLAAISAGSAKAAPLITLELLGSTSQSGPYSSTVTASASSTIYYEVVAQFAPTGTANTNTTHSPNGTTDSINSLPTFVFSDASVAAFTAGSMDSGFGAGTGAGATIGGTGNNQVSIRAVNGSGVYVNADAGVEIADGTLTINSTSPDVINGAFGASSGLVKVGGNLVSVTSTTEGSSDPILGYLGLLINPTVEAVPAPSVVGGAGLLAALGLVTLVARRRSVLA
jgi:hypothetical protein